MAKETPEVKSQATLVVEDVVEETPELNELESKLAEGGFIGVRTIRNSPFFTLENLVRQIEANPIIKEPLENSDNPVLKNYQEFLCSLDCEGFLPLLFNEVIEKKSDGTQLLDKHGRPIVKKYLTFALRESPIRTANLPSEVKRDASHTIIIFEDVVLPVLRDRLDERIRKLDNLVSQNTELSEIDFKIEEKSRLYEIKKYLQLTESEFILLPDRAYEKLFKVFTNLEERRKYLKGIKDDTSARELFYAMIGTAIEDYRASDIHIEALNSEKSRFRYRIDGVLHEEPHRIPNKNVASLLSFIKAKADMLIEEKRRPQDGSIIFGAKYRVDEEDDKDKKTSVQKTISREERELELAREKKLEGYSLRISTMPTQFGEKMAIRIQKLNQKFNLQDLGYAPKVYYRIKEQISAPNGIILFTGPTSSGKSTSIYSVLSELNTPEVNIVTIEDPVEINIQGLNQSAVKKKIGWSFSDSLRTYMRQDPDIIFVGEIRDLETAEVAMEASKTGHLVFSTLHTNDSILSLLRLQDLGVRNADLQASFRSAVAQRLVRTLCDECKVQYDATNELNSLLGKVNLFHSPILAYTDFNSAKPDSHNNCKHCNGYGFKGRNVISEIWVPGKEEKQMIYDGNKNYQAYLSIAARKGMEPLASSGIDLFMQGRTTITELLHWIDREEFYDKSDLLEKTVRDNLKKA